MRYAYIDALRGYAALAVVMTHSGQHTQNLPATLAAVTERGGLGVQLFFVVSALTLMISWSNRKDGCLQFYWRRLFRIAPMFWLAVPLYLWHGGYRLSYWCPQGPGWFEILTVCSFTHGWCPSTINCIVPGGWSIAVEFTFYLFFPLIAHYCTTLPRALAVWALASAFSLWINPYLGPYLAKVFAGEPTYLVEYFSFFWILNQFAVFMAGVCLYRFIASESRVRYPNYLMAMFIAGTGTLLIYGKSGFWLWSVWFCLLTYYLSDNHSTILVNPWIRYFGKVSFSVYLLHFIVIDYLVKLLSHAPRWITPWEPAGTAYFMLLFCLTVLVTGCLATVTFHLCEQPMIKLGQHLSRRLRPSTL